MKILVVDIETAPHLAYVWRFWKEDISPKQVLEHTTILCWSAKWLGKDKIYFESAQRTPDPLDSEDWMLSKLLPLLDEADAVVGHNLSRFDAPKIRGRCLVHNLPLPSPYKEIDTYKIACKEFDFSGNSLKYLAEVLGCTPKSEHKDFPGFELWLECLRGNHKAWKEMKKYNIQDIHATEEVYLKMRPYAPQHPNWGVFAEGDRPVCPKCGGDVKKDGFAHLTAGKYQQYQCKSCGGWARGRENLYDKDKRKTLLTNVS